MSEDVEGLKVYVAMACRVLARGVSAFKIRMQALRHHGRGLLPAEGRVRVHRASPRVRDIALLTQLSVVAYCIGGEKWSVALATVLLHCAKGLGGVIVDPALPHHICSSTWHCACRGNCNLCTNGLHSDVVTQTPGLADAVRRSNEIYLELIG